MNRSKYIFSMKELRGITGLSRTRIIELEKEGILTPVTVNPETGYRYYDITCATRIRQYQMFREYGLSQKEIKDLLNGDLPTGQLILDITQKIEHLTHLRDELQIRENRMFHNTFSFVTLPSVTCFCRTGTMKSVRDTEIFSWRLGEELIKRGYAHCPTEPLFSIRKDTDKINETNLDAPFTVKVCLPIQSKYSGTAAEIETFPETFAFSMLCYTDYANVAQGYLTLWNEVRRRKLTVTGEARGIGLVAPYTNLDLPDSEYVYRFAVPVEKPAED